jgi:hypothetical protein
MTDEAKTAEKQTEAQSPQLGPEWVPSPNGIKEMYSDFLFTNWTATKVRIRFAQLVTKDVPATKWFAEEGAAITMAWPTAKFLRDVLSDAIGRYEKANGELKFPKPPE